MAAGPAGDSWADNDWTSEDWACLEPIEPRDEGDDSLDPLAGPPDGDEAYLAGLPSELAGQYPAGPPAAEAMAAGFLHHVGGPAGAGWAAGGVLDRLPPGPVLADRAAAAAADLAALGESELIGVLCATARLASWAAALQTETVITLARRRAVQARERKDPHLIEHVADELACALTLTGRSASRLLEIAGGLARVAAVRAALTAGTIDWARATLFADELVGLSDADAIRVAALVLGRAGTMTTGQLRAALRRAVAAVDPAAAGRRRTAARQDAAVHVWDEASGNCGLAGRELPPADTIAADHWLTAQARWLQARGAVGTIQQLRAAVFAAVLNGRGVTSLLPPTAGDPDAGDLTAGDPGGATHGGAAGPGGPAGAAATGTAGLGGAGGAAVTGTVNLTMPLSAWLGISDAPGEVPGFGAADAGTCRDLAGRLAAHPATRWCVTTTDGDGHAVAHACARHGPGPPGPPGSTGPPGPPGPPGSPGSAGRTDAAAGRWLAGLRPVRLESGDCSHRLRVPGYRPSRSLRHLIAVRQRTCGFPGCRRPATRCDDDHTVPWDQGGPTCACNLSPLCRRHHRAKQVLGWQLTQPEPGVLSWTLPHGRTYTTVPEPYPL